MTLDTGRNKIDPHVTEFEVHETDHYCDYYVDAEVMTDDDSVGRR